MDIQTISTKIAKGVKHHLFMDGMCPDAETNDFDRGQMAISILVEFIGEDITAEQLRKFLTDCGFTSELAFRIVDSEQDPLCIY
jgi:hypothetical protein